jgi:hypothetical protein
MMLEFFVEDLYFCLRRVSKNLTFIFEMHLSARSFNELQDKNDMAG